MSGFKAIDLDKMNAVPSQLQLAATKTSDRANTDDEGQESELDTERKLLAQKRAAILKQARKKKGDISELKGGDRLYNLFKKKLAKAPPSNIIRNKRPKNVNGMPGQPDDNDGVELCITIPLKGAKGGVSSSEPEVLVTVILIIAIWTTR